MIYSIYFANLKDSYKPTLALGLSSSSSSSSRGYEIVPKFRNKNLKECLANCIKDDSKDNTFVFIVTNAQKIAEWLPFIEKYELKDYISFQFKQPITNGNHDQGRNLNLYILTSKKKEIK